MMLIATCILVFICGFLAGGVVGIVIVIATKETNPSGTLKIQQTDSEGTYLFLELHDNPDNLLSRKYVTFKTESRK